MPRVLDPDPSDCRFGLAMHTYRTLLADLSPVIAIIGHDSDLWGFQMQRVMGILILDIAIAHQRRYLIDIRTYPT